MVWDDFIEDVNYEKVVKETYDYVPINLDYFLNCELQQGRGGKEIVLNNYKLKTVKMLLSFGVMKIMLSGWKET